MTEFFVTYETKDQNVIEAIIQPSGENFATLMELLPKSPHLKVSFGQLVDVVEGGFMYNGIYYGIKRVNDELQMRVISDGTMIIETNPSDVSGAGPTDVPFILTPQGDLSIMQ